jgi:uncharacterized protein YecT (DUF1311 family)
MEERLVLWAAAALLFTSLSSPALAESPLGTSPLPRLQSAAQKFGVQRHPVQPLAVVSAEPALCASLVTELAERFDSIEPDTWDLKPPREASEVAWQPAFPGNDAAGNVSRADLDLDGTGRKQVVIYFADPFRSDRELHYGFVFPTAAAFESARASVAANPPSDDPVPGKKQYDSAEVYFPNALSMSEQALETGDVLAEHALFAWRGHYYFFNGTTRLDRYEIRPISVYRLGGSGRVQEVCRLEVAHGRQVYERLVASPGMLSFLRILRAIGVGVDVEVAGRAPGGSNFGFLHDARATQSEIRAALQPWAVPDLQSRLDPNDAPYYLYNERTERFLRDWSLQDAWSRREYQSLLEHVGPAQAAVSAWLRAEFGIPEELVQGEAVQVIHALIGQRLLVPNDYQGPDSFTQDSLAAVLLTRDRAGLDANPAGDGANAALAVEWPYGLQRLLAAGAKPDLPNEFGKTALMVAAHLNRPDAVRVLLSAGAKVNLATATCAQPQCPYPARTALMYAAENASPVVMKILLDAGADPTAKDSKSDTVDFYLAHNPRLRTDQVKLGARGVANLADQFATPGFRCEQARSAVEKAICGSEVLRVFDGELSRAYGEFRARYGEAAVAEQRAWLAQRDTRCRADAGDFADCLAEVLRTRIRYLHNRLHEGTVTTPH